jgi:hypothetical protein
VREEYIIKRQGKDYVLYPGLLNEVHERFDNWSIATEIIETGEQPVVRAYFRGSSEKGPTICTSGIGTGGRQGDDKQPAARTAPVEMAETRAKARALRDAVNIGETAFEELPSEAGNSGATQTDPYTPSKPSTTASKLRGVPNQPSTPQEEPNPLGAQIKKSTLSKLQFMVQTYADATGQKAGEHKKKFEEELGCKLGELGQESAEVWIGRYQRALDKLEGEGGE